MQNRTCICLHIDIDIEGIKTTILIDTGSEITCMSEEFFLANERILKNCAKMPITGKNVRVAIGNKSTKITSQILCQVKIGEFEESIIFVIVPGLAKNCILGYDAQKDLKIMIIAENDTMILNNQTIKFNLPESKNDATLSQIECCDHTIKINEFYCPQERNFDINSIVDNQRERVIYEEDDETLVSEQKITEKISSNQIMDEQQKKSMIDFICKYKNVFDKNPGLIKNFEYELSLKDEKPFFIKPYPIPLKYEAKVDAEIEKMLDLGLISRSNSNYINPVLIVVKKDGSL